ncbi:hypothetical protein Ahy_A09g042311 isoform A [Arachis hypogaea]|uniref:mitogen-activated protein kinase kinase kinase n=1 Tax=Arachis hypogaea TaxID=3818 RepID=A0A445BFF4_ARAHY|nr:hypothetical protein Ahy_A09g042311 isoform A [Arachis hypogaea]
MKDFLGSVRQSFVFRTPPPATATTDEDGLFAGFVDRISSTIRKSRVGLFSQPRLKHPRVPSPPTPPKCSDDAPPFRWRKGELIGSGAFGRVYMGMNLDSGELIAVKQVLIAPGCASKKNTHANNIRELEEEVKLLKNLKHPNIVRYLGTAREEDSLNILLEFVPGGSISSLLGKFGSFPEPVIKMYTKQLLLGLEYLHDNGIIHRDIKGANILVDNKGCIKLADFGASKKVVELATINGTKSIKGTPHWMSPEVILQTGHTISTDIWSVACTVIEMATGKPPWSQQYPQEASALYYIGTTKSHPPIPEYLSAEAQDFLLKCFHKEPDLRPSASDLLLHPFISCNYRESHSMLCSSIRDSCNATHEKKPRDFLDSVRGSTCTGVKDVCQLDSIRLSTMCSENFLKADCYQRADSNDDDICQIADEDDFLVDTSVKPKSLSTSEDIKSFNPMCEPVDDWPCKFDEDLNLKESRMNLSSAQAVSETMTGAEPYPDVKDKFSFSCEHSGDEDDDEVTESKIKAFLDEKAIELKKLQTPLFEEYLSVSNAAIAPIAIAPSNDVSKIPNATSQGRSPSHARRRLSMAGSASVSSSKSHNKYQPQLGGAPNQPLQEIQPSDLNESKETLHEAQPGSFSVRASFSERQRKWKEELVKRKWKEDLFKEMDFKREIWRKAGLGGKITSPKDCEQKLDYDF